jgi:hypothetical protein
MTFVYGDDNDTLVCADPVRLLLPIAQFLNIRQSMPGVSGFADDPRYRDGIAACMC